ncbi:carbohydrate ABC transporter permease [Paenibacillus hodogayensis]|uniref:Carbohydrate ABC transporter permease n=1 Tax=Paenibacillus hodogayensis TaxID=279208 RepID=A0ABV5W489_9BACL
MTKSNGVWRFSLHAGLLLLCLLSMLPLWLLISASLTEKSALLAHGFTFVPSKASLDAYRYIWNQSEAVMRGYGISIFVTVTGTVAGIAISALLAYPLSRNGLPFKNFWMFAIFFTLLFNGGLVPTYLVYTQIFDIKNTLWALLIPGLLTNGFIILLLRTFFTTSIPVPILESAYVDGAGEFKIFYKMVLPLSLPILATTGLTQMIGYWNDWFNGLIYVTDNKLFSLQNLLNRILMDMQYLKNNSTMGEASRLAADTPSESIQMAMAVIGTLPLIMAYPFFQRFFVKGLTVGAVKG